MNLRIVSHDVKEFVVSEPNLNGVLLSLDQSGIGVATAKEVDERVRNGKPTPHHSMHIAQIIVMTAHSKLIIVT